MKLPINQVILPWPPDTEPALEPSPNGGSGSINMLWERRNKRRKQSHHTDCTPMHVTKHLER